MARQQNIYKVDRRDIQEQLALAAVLGNTEKLDIINGFCELFSIPTDDDVITQRIADLTLLRDAILADAKQKNKK